MNIAYLRVSTERQQVANQREEIIRYARMRGFRIDHWVMETVSGGCRKENRRLGNLLEELREGDVLIVTELSRLSRSLYEIMNILNHCLKSGITLYSTKDGYAFDHSLNSKVLAFAFGLVAEIERNLISLRTREALAVRQRAGARLGRPADYSPKFKLLCEAKNCIEQMLRDGVPVTDICRKYGVSRSTFYKYLSCRTEE